MLSLPRFTRVILLLLAASARLLLAPATLPAFEQPPLSIGSGNGTGADYAASSAIAKIFNRKSAEYGMRLATVESGGSLANIDSVILGKTAFGIAQAPRLQQVTNGLGPWEGRPEKGLRAVLGLHVEAVTIVAASDREIERVKDLRGKRINIGGPGSSDHDYATLLLEGSGVPLADVTLSEHSAVLASELLQKDRIDAYIHMVGHPTLSLLEASSGKRKVRLVALEEPFIEQATGANPLLLPAVIPTDYYPGLERQGVVRTIGVRAVLFARADMAEETVYRLVREVMENFDLFKRQHPLLQGLTPREACDITVLPYHPGAERYFRQVGLTP
jgi:TRAP transporter TAXI family solute receptor